MKIVKIEKDWYVATEGTHPKAIGHGDTIISAILDCVRDIAVIKKLKKY